MIKNQIFYLQNKWKNQFTLLKSDCEDTKNHTDQNHTDKKKEGKTEN